MWQIILGFGSEGIPLAGGNDDDDDDDDGDFGKLCDGTRQEFRSDY